MEGIFNTQQDMLVKYMTCVSLLMLIHNYVLVTHTHMHMTPDHAATVTMNITS